MAQTTFTRSQKLTCLILPMTRHKKPKALKISIKKTLKFFRLCFKLPLFIMLFNDS